MTAVSLTDLPLELELTGKLVRLRAFTPDDGPAVFAACADPEIRHFTSFTEPRTVEDSRAWIQSQADWRREGHGINFAIVGNGADAAGDPAGRVGPEELIGSIDLAEVAPDHRRANIGYWVIQAHRRRGYATAALELLSRWALGPPLDLVQLELNADAQNLPSRRTAERVGYELVGIVPSGLFAKGRHWDLARYARLRSV